MRKVCSFGVMGEVAIGRRINKMEERGLRQDGNVMGKASTVRQAPYQEVSACPFKHKYLRSGASIDANIIQMHSDRVEMLEESNKKKDEKILTLKAKIKLLKRNYKRSKSYIPISNNEDDDDANSKKKVEEEEEEEEEEEA
ncbi:hypothetical protein COCNU_scaffold003686G000020 [Cocos nucifera]|nr:hypothetical protein [Cocos nucifera]